MSRKKIGIVPFTFPFEPDARSISFPFEDIHPIHDFEFPVLLKPNEMSFPVQERSFSDAILGVMDPYTLGELSRFTLDMKMWPDQSGLVPQPMTDADEISIFALTLPYQFLFQYRNAFQGKLKLDMEFMGGYGLTVRQLYMALLSGFENPPLYLSKEVNGTSVRMRLKYSKPALDRWVELACKSILGKVWALGEMDLFALGKLDSMPLWAFSNQAAAVMNLHTGAARADRMTEPTLVQVQSMLCGATQSNLLRERELTGQGVSQRLSGLVSRRSPTLGELDQFTLGELDVHTLNVYLYDKIPAVVTAE